MSGLSRVHCKYFLSDFAKDSYIINILSHEMVLINMLWQSDFCLILCHFFFIFIIIVVSAFMKSPIYIYIYTASTKFCERRNFSAKYLSRIFICIIILCAIINEISKAEAILLTNHVFCIEICYELSC